MAEILDERQIKRAKINRKQEDLFKTESDEKCDFKESPYRGKIKLNLIKIFGFNN